MNAPEAPAPATNPRLAVALARAERRLEVLEEFATMGLALAREINQRYIEGPRRDAPRPDPARAFAAVSRAVRLTLILEAKIEKQILAWRKGDLSSIDALILPPEPFLKPRFDSALSRRERVRDQVSAAIEREAGDPNEAEWMRDRVRRQLLETEHLDDHRLEGGFRACVETICSDLGLEPDWSRWSDETGFMAPAPPTGERAPPLGATDPPVAGARRAEPAGVDFAASPDHAPLATKRAYRPPPSRPPEPEPKCQATVLVHLSGRSTPFVQPS